MNDARALLVTDLVDSTAIANALGDDAMSALWAEHDRRARQLLQAWRGREIDRSDGFFLLFDRAGDALGFGLAWHRALAHLGAERLAERGLGLATRTGIHVGAVQLRENPAEDVARGAKPLEADGLAKAVAARVMALARGAQTLLTAGAHEALLGESAAGLAPELPPLRSHGRWKLKGLDDPIELFEAGDERTTFEPPEDAEKAHRVVWRDGHWLPVREVSHHLPAEPDRFVGRGASLRALARLFDDGARLVTVHGMGGSGKTRLALHHGWRWLGDYAAGAWFCDLAAARDLDGLVRAVAQGLQMPLGRGDAVELIGHAIAGRGPCLVILDNFEQIAALAETSVARWLKRAPKARFLVTSREVLGIAGEQVLQLEPMEADEAAALFRQRLQAVGAAPTLGQVDERAIEPLMDLLDRLPLAIELAAARCRLLPPHELLVRMSDRFEVLSGRVGRPDRQATLRAALDWSWDLLSGPERSALAQLSVFEGGFTLSAAEAVLNLSAHRQAPAGINVVQALIEKAFVRQVGIPPRLGMLQTIREYAAHQRKHFEGLETDAAHVSEAAGRHARHFAGSHMRRSNAELARDLENLVAATRFAAAAGDADVAIGALEGAWRALKLRGPYGLLLELVGQVQMLSNLGASQLGRLDAVAGWALKATGRSAEARMHLERALSALRSTGDERRESEVASDLGEVHSNAGRIEEALSAFEAALGIARRTGIETLKWPVLTGLGNLSWRKGDLDGALRHHEGALAAARQAGDRQWEGGSLGNLGVMQANLGRTAEAEASYLEALAISRELGDRTFEGNTLCNLGLLQHVRGDDARAAMTMQSALTVAKELGHRRLEEVVHCNLGMTHESLRAPLRARAHYESALQIAREIRDRTSQGQALSYLGALHARQGRFDDARGCLVEAEELLRSSPDKLSLAMLLCARAECEQLQGHVDGARSALAAARVIAEEVGSTAGAELHQAVERVSRLLRTA